MTENELITLRLVEKDSESTLASQIVNDTTYCRESDVPLLIRFREELEAREIDISTSLLWVYDVTDETQIDGIVATSCAKIYEFYFLQGVMSKWQEITHTWKSSEYAEEIEVAKKMHITSDT